MSIDIQAACAAETNSNASSLLTFLVMLFGFYIAVDSIVAAVVIREAVKR